MGEVVDIFSRSRIRTTVVAGISTPETASKANSLKAALSDFEEVARQNAANQERIRKERSQANQGVLKSYRIK